MDNLTNWEFDPHREEQSVYSDALVGRLYSSAEDELGRQGNGWGVFDDSDYCIHPDTFFWITQDGEISAFRYSVKPLSPWGRFERQHLEKRYARELFITKIHRPVSLLGKGHFICICYPKPDPFVSYSYPSERIRDFSTILIYVSTGLLDSVPMMCGGRISVFRCGNPKEPSETYEQPQVLVSTGWATDVLKELGVSEKIVESCKSVLTGDSVKSKSD